MALAASAAWEVRTTGSDSNGGGFVASGGGTDFSQQNAAQVSIDNATITTSITGTTVTFTSGYTATAADVGNLVQFLTGTNVTAGFYQITGFTSSTWTLDRTPITSGTTTNATAKMGGALATPGKVASGWVASNTMYVKNGTYSFSGSANVAGGKISLTVAGGDTTPNMIIGYNTTRTLTNTDVGPTFQATVNNTILIDNNTGGSFVLYNLIFNANGFTGCTAQRNNNNPMIVERCQAIGAFATGFSNTSSVTSLINCYAKSCITGFNLFQTGSSARFCVADSCGGNSAGNGGFSDTGVSGGRYFQCISRNCTGYGFYSQVADSHYEQCTSDNTAVGGAGSGSGFSGSDRSQYFNCLSTNNAKWGFATNQSTNFFCKLVNCAGFNNTSGNVDTTFGTNINFQTLTASPYTNTAGGDYSLNSTAGGGAACRGAGYVSSYIGINTTSFFDIGAVQHLVIIAALILIPMRSQADEVMSMNPGSAFISSGLTSPIVIPQPPPLPPRKPKKKQHEEEQALIVNYEFKLPTIISGIVPPPFAKPPGIILTTQDLSGIVQVVTQRPPDSGYAFVAPVYAPPPPPNPPQNPIPMPVFAAQVAPPMEPEPGMVFGVSGFMGAVPAPSNVPPPQVVIARQVDPDPLPEVSRVSITSASQFIQPTAQVILNILNNPAYFVFIPEDLFCPFDKFSPIVIYLQIKGSNWLPVYWQCSEDPGHNGVLTGDPSLVPSQIQGSWAQFPADSTVSTPLPSPYLPGGLGGADILATPSSTPLPNVDSSIDLPDDNQTNPPDTNPTIPAQQPGPITRIQGSW